MVGDAFLKLVARDLLSKYKNELSDIVVVFPNNRARLFFNEYLFEEAGGPLWSPTYTTIKDLFQSHSSLQLADSIRLVCMLYKAYSQVLVQTNQTLPAEEQIKVDTLDSFYHWGEVLLADFEDVDSNKVDASQLFQNVKDLAEYEGAPAEILTEEQKVNLRKFFSTFDAEDLSVLKKRFLFLWKTLMPTYTLFQNMLLSENLAYEGMLKRHVVETMEKQGTAAFTATKYVFIGFNVLNKCEEELFHRLNMANKAIFYWDVDEYYMKKQPSGMKNEAALFMEGNVSKFKNELESCFTQSALEQKNRNFSIISASTESAQAKYVEQFLSACKSPDKSYRDTAIVLCNESLLLSVLHSIPTEVEKVNITMGLPIVQTPVYGMIQLLLEYQDLLYYYSQTEHRSMNTLSLSAHLILPLIRNHYLRQAYPELIELEKRLYKEKKRYFKLSELKEVSVLFQDRYTPADLLSWLSDVAITVAEFLGNSEDVESDHSQLYQETIYRFYMILQRLLTLLNDRVLDVDYPLLVNLIDQLVSSTSVPFTGNELQGCQIMGFLETRNLDFSNVILLSANEGTLPNTGKETSFIPYNLRVGFGMTTVEHKNALYAYYFYRLLQRAENVTFLYNVSTEGSSKGQMSRFLMQLLVESDIPVKRKNLQGKVTPAEPQYISVEKSEEVRLSLKKKYDRLSGGKSSFSPSSFLKFLKCPLSFYMSYMLGLRKENELEDEVQASEFGTIFHAAMKNYYEDLLGENIHRVIEKSEYPEDPKRSTDPSYKYRLEKCVDKAFREEYFMLKDPNERMPELSGDQLLNREAAIRNMRRMLAIDKEYAPFSIVSMEKPYEKEFEITLEDGSNVKILLKGTIDRVDKRNGVTRVLDYKTGGSPAGLGELVDLFENPKFSYPLQVFLYANLYAHSLPSKGEVTIKPAIAYLNSCDTLEDLDLHGNKKSVSFDDKVIDDVVPYFEELEDEFKRRIGKIFSAEQPFAANKTDESCKYCDFKTFCGVKEKSF